MPSRHNASRLSSLCNVQCAFPDELFQKVLEYFDLTLLNSSQIPLEDYKRYIRLRPVPGYTTHCAIANREGKTIGWFTTPRGAAMSLTKWPHKYEAQKYPILLAATALYDQMRFNFSPQAAQDHVQSQKFRDWCTEHGLDWDKFVRLFADPKEQSMLTHPTPNQEP